jgi:hypothetical protein
MSQKEKQWRLRRTPATVLNPIKVIPHNSINVIAHNPIKVIPHNSINVIAHNPIKVIRVNSIKVIPLNPIKVIPLYPIKGIAHNLGKRLFHPLDWRHFSGRSHACLSEV